MSDEICLREQQLKVVAFNKKLATCHRLLMGNVHLY